MNNLSTVCTLSTTRAHCWLINSDNVGVFLYCNDQKQFPLNFPYKKGYLWQGKATHPTAQTRP